jgi:wobble nucleotide-excising tRNase
VKVRRLQRARDYRIFRDFTWPVGLDEFARFNVVYGWNGAGKTALSNVFRQMERRLPLEGGQVEVLVDETRVLGADFSIAALPQVRTFNRDTVDRSVFEASAQQFPPVFFLGEDSVEKQKKIEDLNAALTSEVEEQSRRSRVRDSVSNALDTFCSEEAKAIKNLLTVAGGGPYNNYNAANFKAGVEGLDREVSVVSLPADVRQGYLAKKDAIRLDRLTMPPHRFPDVLSLTTRLQKLLKHSLVTAAMDELVIDPKLSSWVNAGLHLHTGGATTTCKFCSGVIPEGRLEALEAHFDDEYERFQGTLQNLSTEIEAATTVDFIDGVPPKEALYPDLRAAYEAALRTVREQTGTTKTYLAVLLRSIKAKRENPFRTFELSHFFTNFDPEARQASGFEQFIQLIFSGVATLSAVSGATAFQKVEGYVEQHNKTTEQFDQEIATARAQLARDELVKAHAEWKRKSDLLSEARASAELAATNAANFRAEIKALEVEVRQHRRPAEELNREIAAYLGRDELKFEVESNGYRITRGGQSATHLSDGERTAIAFLYFLKSLRANDFDLQRGVVVIDDPVSSLDANSLFSAFGFMKQCTLDAGQLFVLTHNFAFFRQVRNWFGNLPGQKKRDVAVRPARFYMLTAEYSTGKRSAALTALDGFLHQYESEYHYLFKRVYEEAHKIPLASLETYYAMPNIARRLLEAFLAFRLPHVAGELFNKMEMLNHDPVGKTRILRFLHTYSHADQVSESGHDPSVLVETPAVLKEVLALLKHTDPGHFANMEFLVSPEALID